MTLTLTKPPAGGKFLAPRRVRAILVADRILRDAENTGGGDAVDLVLGIRPRGWDVRLFAARRARLARELANLRWSLSEIAEAIHSDRRTVSKWLGGTGE